MVHTYFMSTTKRIKTIVSVPAQIAHQEQALFELAECFRSSKDPDEVKKLGDELGRLVFGK
jgi:hypothetical protein